MAIKSKISEELKATIAAHPHIQDVHFTATGEHFFNTHEHKEKGAKAAKTYGRLKLEAVHVGNEGDRKIYKNQNVPVPETEIVETVSREDILKAKTDAELKAEAEIKAADEMQKAVEATRQENEELKKKIAELEKAAKK